LKTLALLLSVILAGCHTKAVETPAKPFPTPEEILKDLGRNHATLADQKTCSDQAKKFFEESEAREASMVRMTPSSYVSHFDPNANICYVMVIDIFSIDGKKTLTTSYEVSDAFEGRTYGEYMWNSTRGKKNREETPDRCEVTPRGGMNDTVCKSAQEFHALVMKYFGLGL
jgi:hypothetical protein